MENKSRRYIVCSVLISLLVCSALLLEIYLENMCTNYAKTNYDYSPLYRTRIIFCFVWAVSTRVVIAIMRKKDYTGTPRVRISSIIAFLIFAIIGAFDLILFTHKLIWNQLFDILLILSFLCCIMRERKKE